MPKLDTRQGLSGPCAPQSRAVTFRNARPSARRPALCLALLALIAQLWLAQISTGHLARMLGERAAWGDICTTAGVAHADDTAPAGDHGSPTTTALSCPVCVVGATTLAPAQLTASAQPPVWALQRLPVAHAPVRARHRAGLRPPAQAPPAA